MDPKKALLKKRRKLVLERDGLSTGSTMLNLACTDNPRYGLFKGGYYFFWGDTASGKTWLTMTCMAEAQMNPNFKDYELHFINVEGGALMDIRHYFGKKVAHKLVSHDSIETIQAFYRLMYDLLVVQKKKAIFVLDSENALDNLASKKKFKENKNRAEKGDKEKGSYGDGKAKFHSENIRWVLSAVRKTRSIFIVIGQSRDNINAMGWDDKKTKSGGRSLSFYANLEMQSRVGSAIRKEVRGKNREVGSNVVVQVRKNRVTGKVGKARSATIPIYHGHGIDDVGSVVDFLISENYFEPLSEKGKYKIPDVDFSGTRNEIIEFAEKNDAHGVLQDMAGKVWKEIEDECLLVNRKRRYE
jgi:RecA/RadA recombinase